MYTKNSIIIEANRRMEADEPLSEEENEQPLIQHKRTRQLDFQCF
jgi:hypothetical protein